MTGIVSNQTLLNLYNRFVFGKNKNNYSLADFRKEYSKLIPPVVFLSTGRCGTLWLTELIEASKNCFPIHHPAPVMRSQGALSYQFDYNLATQNEKTLLNELFLAGREEVLVKCQRVGKSAVITDCRGTFFAEAILNILPQTKFVFLHRHPGEVIRSGVNRGWYKVSDNSDLNRITPRKTDPFFEKWEQASQLEKNAWQWDATNEWILNFLKQVPENQQHHISFNEWNKETLTDLMQFVDAKNSISLISKRLQQKSNPMKGTSILPKYQEWNAEQKKVVATLCGKTAEKLGYNL